MILHGIELDSEAIRGFCRKWKIKELWVFGSVLRNDFRPDSDVDFLAEFEKGACWDAFEHMDMEEELAPLVGRRVDIVNRKAVEESRNRLRKREILSTAETLIAPG